MGNATIAYVSVYKHQLPVNEVVVVLNAAEGDFQSATASMDAVPNARRCYSCSTLSFQGLYRTIVVSTVLT